MRGCGGVTPPITSAPGPSGNLMGISRSRSGPVCIEFLFITPLAESSSVGAVICYGYVGCFNVFPKKDRFNIRVLNRSGPVIPSLLCSNNDHLLHV